MNYLKTYCSLMRRAQQRGWVKSTSAQYLEDHHIFPKSIFGKNYIPEGRIHIAKSLKKFCKEHNLGAGHMYNVANGKLKQHKGWTVKNAK